MNERLKNIYRSYLIDYIKKVSPETKPNEKKLILCPFHCSKEPTAQISHNKISCYTPTCQKIVNIFEYIRETKSSWKDKTDEDIGDYLQHLLKIEIVDDTDELLERYAEAGFCLIPIAPETKRPTIKWKEKYYKNPKIWKDWIDRGWGLAIRLGSESGVIAVDIDDEKTHEEVKFLMGETLRQETNRGFHYIYKFDPEIKKTLNKVMRDAGYEMEYRTEGAYIVVAPTSVNGEIRKWNDKKISPMSEKLKDLFLKYYKKGVQEQTVDEEIQEDIDNEKLSVVDLGGKRNDTFLKTAGIFSKWMPKDTTYKVLNFLSNNWIDKPIPKKELFAMMEQIKRYRTFDKEQLSKVILSRLEIIGEGTAYQIASSLRIEVKDVEEILKYLEDQGKVIPGHNRKYSLVNDVEWTTDTNDLSVPIDFQVPYFSKYARFDFSNMIIIGGATGTGKTHLVGNIIKKLVDQGIKPYLINTEAGSKIGKITEKLKVPPHSYYLPKKIVKHPMDIELVDNGVTVIDWLKVKEGDYAKTDSTYEHFHEQLKKHGGLLIIMTQLRSSNKEFFAQDQVAFYSALLAKYQFGDGGKDNQNTFFKIEKIRDSRSGKQYIEIPMYFDPITGIVEER